MKFLWMSNSPWSGTGYGQQTKMVLRHLKGEDHEPTCFAFYGLQGGEIDYDGYPVWPGSDFESWGNDVVQAHIDRAESQSVITLMDLFVLAPHVWMRLSVPWIAWTPVDHEDIGFPTLERLQHVDFPVAMSQFGASEMEKVGIEPAAVIPHAVDTDIFQPMDKEDCRKKLGIDPDCYLVGMVMANKGDRKQYPKQLAAVREWMDSYPDRNIKIFTHTDPTSQMGGWDMKALVKKLGLKGHVYSTNQYDAVVRPVDSKMMAVIHNSFDVLMNASAGEGFGVPIIEAQACGVPVVTTEATSMTELTHYGYAVKPRTRDLVTHYGYQFSPDPEDLVYRLESVYRMASKQKGIDARAWVEHNFSAPVVGSLWHELLFNIEAAGFPKRTLTRQVIGNGTRPQGRTNDVIRTARVAMEHEEKEYGSFADRLPEYATVYKLMEKMGLKNGDYVLDLGAGYADLDRYMRDQAWWGVYVPVDMMIDGTDVSTYHPPEGFDFIVLQQIIEHLENWKEVLERCEGVGGAVILTTPNGEIVTKDHKHDFEGQMAHVAWLTQSDLEALGYAVSLISMGGKPNDTMLAWKVCNEGESEDEHRAPEAIRSGS